MGLLCAKRELATQRGEALDLSCVLSERSQSSTFLQGFFFLFLYQFFSKILKIFFFKFLLIKNYKNINLFIISLKTTVK